MRAIFTDWRWWVTIAVALLLVLLSRVTAAFAAGMGAQAFYLHFLRDEP